MLENLHNYHQNFSSQGKQKQAKKERTSRSIYYNMFVEGNVEMSSSQNGFVKKRNLCHTNRISFPQWVTGFVPRGEAVGVTYLYFVMFLSLIHVTFS